MFGMALTRPSLTRPSLTRPSLTDQTIIDNTIDDWHGIDQTITDQTIIDNTIDDWRGRLRAYNADKRRTLRATIVTIQPYDKRRFSFVSNVT